MGCATTSLEKPEFAVLEILDSWNFYLFDDKIEDVVIEKMIRQDAFNILMMLRKRIELRPFLLRELRYFVDLLHHFRPATYSGTKEICDRVLLLVRRKTKIVKVVTPNIYACPVGVLVENNSVKNAVASAMRDAAVTKTKQVFVDELNKNKERTPLDPSSVCNVNDSVAKRIRLKSLVVNDHARNSDYGFFEY
jgi:hypothetical protein